MHVSSVALPQRLSVSQSVHPAVTTLVCFIHRCFLTFSVKKCLATAVCPSVCPDRGPPVTGPCLSRGGRERGLLCPAHPRHALHGLALLRLQLPFCPEPVATSMQAGVCRSDGFQSCSSVDEGAYLSGLFQMFCLSKETLKNHYPFCILHKNGFYCRLTCSCAV